MEIFDAIERAFVALRASGRLDLALGAWRSRQADLGDVDCLDVLVRRCRGPETGSRRQKDSIHVALCLEASGKERDELAGVVLCWLFLPGLSDLLRNLAEADGDVDPDDVAGDLLAGFWEAASRVGSSSTHVARHLLRGARRRALRGLRGARARPREAEPGEDPVDRAALPQDLMEDRLVRAIDAGVLSERQAELVLATRSSIAEMAARHGLSVLAAQQARHRARQRLLSWLTDS